MLHMLEQKYVQPIIVTKTGNHQDVIAAAAVASFLAKTQTPNAPEWTPWLATNFTKTVRRANQKQFEEIQKTATISVSIGQAQACAYPPMEETKLPKIIKKLQVSGTEMKKTQTLLQPTKGSVIVTLNDTLQMSTGKASAQASHALWLWALKENPETVKKWTQTPSIHIEELTEAEFKQQCEQNATVVKDSGHTEIKPGSLTATARYVS